MLLRLVKVLLILVMFSNCGELDTNGTGGFVIEPESTAAYVRADWKHWVDLDSDCQDTRQEVLLDSASNAELDSEGCKVLSGNWVDPYSGDT